MPHIWVDKSKYPHYQKYKRTINPDDLDDPEYQPRERVKRQQENFIEETTPSEPQNEETVLSNRHLKDYDQARLRHSPSRQQLDVAH